MGTPQVYTWPVAVTTAVALLQSRTGAGALVLNGTLVNTNLNVKVADFGRVNRVVSLTSANNLSGINITITGTLNGVAVSETRAGPNANTVETTQVFSTVTSVTTTGTVTAISLGTGTVGTTAWFTSDRFLGVTNLSIQVDVTATVSYSFQVTNDDVNGNNSPFTATPITAMTTASTDQLAGYTVPFRFCRIAMISSDATGAMTANLLQQGVKA